MKGLYVHIPFCASRCVYCGFYSTTRLEWRRRYVEALCRELDLRLPEPAGLGTVYVGGGTPSQLGADGLSTLFAAIAAHSASPLGRQGMEVTVECNPDDVTPDLAGALAGMGVNRVSMGVQTFDDQRLRLLHRRHTAEEAVAAVERLRAAGIDNISIDLMFGFPSETTAQWEEDLRTALALGPQHISAYSLMYEEGTPLYDKLQRGEIVETGEEESRAMYDRLIDLLTAAGYEHYEISNFARPGFRSRHNSSYWHGVPYVGIGAAAHSYNKVERSWNVADIRAYMEGMERGERVAGHETLDLDTRYDDLITTALRTREGIDMARMRAEYGAQLHQYLLDMARPHIRRGLMSLNDGRLALTREGLYVSDDIMSDLMHV